MGGCEIKRAYELYELLQKLIMEEDETLAEDQRTANAMAKMDAKTGKEWRKQIQPDGIKFIELKEGGSFKPPSDFFEKINKLMLEEEKEPSQFLDNSPHFNWKNANKNSGIKENLKIIINIETE